MPARSASLKRAGKSLEKRCVRRGLDGLLLGASGSQLLLDGMPTESTPAERSFADLLNAAGVASICFLPRVERDEFLRLTKAFTEMSSKAGSLGERLEHYFGKGTRSGIRVNEIRFVAEDAAFSEARVAAQLTAKTLGADAERVQDWFRNPEKMIQLIAAAEGAHGGPAGPGAGGSRRRRVIERGGRGLAAPAERRNTFLRCRAASPAGFRRLAKPRCTTC